MELQEEILSVLSENARLTIEQISHIVNQPEDKVRETIALLEKKQAIIAYQCVIDWKKIGKQKVRALIDVQVTPQQAHGFDVIAKRIAMYNEVVNVYLMSGAYDLSITLEVDSLEAVGLFVTEKLAPLDFVVNTRTHFILKKYKEADVLLDTDGPDNRLHIAP
ncbi:Lrp/AsnC family transcriptional regulator [Shimazuella sp. AN120528]|uniref:Lrp/AsnC family transcriptional regulator n=1 Tax=Shimazuella soli TaxID=1892854 RepID=UPI001F11235B|nr:Lrp/AsnC family transcriptional regulator [Shimazuella soli]MCH5586503.1 Lrp/AsnC family transcriptional regulator [Shimazuella soli]